ncbi:MAG: hypothetical protein H0V89_10575 [Deltaproteobacteria bacterium]|nr:hypothetical protein [Deltaproteobacteria bacterium]
MIHHTSGGTFAEAIDGLTGDPSFRAWLTNQLRAAPFRAFRWETPAVTAPMLGRPFEFVLVEDRHLARRPDLRSFAEHFQPDADVVAFPSLGRDAVLIAPCPQGDPARYAHLGVFVREAPPAQIDALWARVGREVSARIAANPAPVWTSTAGGGVAWLHVRLDDRPKYYVHLPYADPRS